MRVWAAAALLLAGAACSKQTALESGALMLSLSTASGAAAPDELRISVYDDTGVLWRDARVPASGALVPESASRLGTVLVQPGATSGNLRLHVRGLIAGARALDGLLVVTPAERSRGTFDLTLDPAQLADDDADGVPDAIDDCPGAADPDQRGCSNDDGGGGGGGAGGGGGGEGGGSGGVAAAVRRSTRAWTSAPTVVVTVRWAPRAAPSFSARPGSASTASAAAARARDRAAPATSPARTACAWRISRGQIPIASARQA